MKKKVLIFLLIISTSFIFSLEVPKLKGMVNDYGNVLSSSEEKRLETILRNIESTTSSEIAILTISSLKGDNLESFSIRTVDKWKLGKKGKDNGVLLLVALDERKIRIEVGYGAEAVLTDAKSSYIIRNIISPYFKKNQMAMGLEEGVKAISGLLSKEFTISEEDLRASQKSEESSGGFPVTFIFIIVFWIVSALGRGRHGRRRGSGLTSFFILNSLLGSSSRSSSSGGFSGGGFSGFSGGGGGFGGGGSSGGW